MKQNLRILHLEDNPNDAELIISKLEAGGYACDVKLVESRDNYSQALKDGCFDLIMADYTLPSFDGMTALAMARESCPDTPFIFVSGTIGEERAIAALREGATDYVLKNNLARLAPAVSRALKEAEEHRERMQAQEGLRESEDRYRPLFENMLDGFAYCRMIYENGRPHDFVYLIVNDSFERLTGLKDVIGKKATEAIPGIRETDSELLEIYGRVALTGKSEKFEIYVEALRTWFFISVYSPRREHFVAVFDVITDRKQAEQEREVTIEFLRLVNESADTRGLIRAATAFFQQQSGCEAVGVRLRQGEDYPYFETRGFPKEFVVAENSLCARDSENCVIRDNKGNPVIECMCGNVICGRFDPAKSFFTTHGGFWANDTTELLRSTTEADRQVRTRNRCNGSGYESVALLPLRIGAERLGLLQLNDRRKGVFSPVTIGLWERLADQLAVALAKLQTEEALRQSKARFATVFRSSPIGIVLSRLDDGVFLDVNDSFLDVYGFAREELIGHSSLEINMWVDPGDRARMVAALREKGRVRNFEVKFRKRSGEIGDLLISAEKIELAGEQCLVGMFNDITERKRAKEAIQKSEKKYQDLIDSTLDGIFQVNAEGAFTFMNMAGARIFGYDSPDEIIGRNALDYWRDPKDRDVYRAELKTHKKLSGYPMKAKKKNGEPIELESSTRMLEDEKGNFLGLEGILRDVTSRKRAEEELQSSIQMWNNTFDAMDEAITIMDANGKILRGNRAMLDLLGTDLDKIVGRTHGEIMHPAEGRQEQCAFSRMQQSLRRESLTFQFYQRWFNVTADPVIDRLGKLAGGVYVMTDITEHRQFEEQLKESESKFRSLAEQSLAGTYVIQAGAFKYVNRRFAEIFGYAAGEVIESKTPLELVIPEDRHLVASNLQKRISGDTPDLHYDFRGLKKNGDIIQVEVYGSRALYQGGRAVIGVIVDISEKKKLEGQLLQAQKMEAVGQLTGGIAHDFNNILSAIIGYGTLLQMKMAEGDPLRSFVDKILASTDRAANLIRSLLTFSRKQIVNLMPVDANEIIGRVEKLVRSIIGEDIDFRTTLAPRGLIINADAGQIEQVLVNLVTNACDAMPKGGALFIETGIVELGEAFEKPAGAANGEYVLLSVSDTGIGMDEKTREKIFEPFFTTKDLGRGTGLGLAMVYGIIKQHGGNILCYSEPGKGTTFKVYLPLLHSGAQMATQKMDAAAIRELSRGTETILVVEDDQTLRSLAKMTLEDSGYTVIEAVDGEDAVRQFVENKDRIQLILCDVIMPGKNGEEVRQEIVKISSAVKILFMSGYSADIIRQKSMLEDVGDILLKPILPSMLLKKVREVLDRKQL